MGRKIDILGVSGTETTIGVGVSVEGSLNSEGDIKVDGIFTGDITTLGDISLGVNSVVRGALTGQNIDISGILEGNVTAQGETSIRETGQVHGNISAISMAITPGAIFVGRSQMKGLTKPSDKNSRNGRQL